MALSCGRDSLRHDPDRSPPPSRPRSRLAGASAAIERAWAIDAKAKTGTIKDVDHVVILMQENRSFDHYFGTMNGVRGFADRFPIPLPGGRTVWAQANTKAQPAADRAFPAEHGADFRAHARRGHAALLGRCAVRLGRWPHEPNWPDHKQPHAMGYYIEADIPFQWALANAFTLCEAYHCSFQGGTNTNRLFHWTGTNDPAGKRGGPRSPTRTTRCRTKAPSAKEPYTWTHLSRTPRSGGRQLEDLRGHGRQFRRQPACRLQGVPRQHREGAGQQRGARGERPLHPAPRRAARRRAGRPLPQVSWIISPAKDCEHPGPSSPAQGADYIARVLDA